MAGKRKGQSVIEFLSTYSWSFLILAVFMAVVASYVFTRGANTFSPSYCYISPELLCQEAFVMSNSSGSTITLIFVNNLGTGISFAANAFSISPTFGQQKYLGTCYPANAVQGSLVICNATAPGYVPSTGQQLEPTFTLTYSICQKACQSQLYNTSGTGTVFASPYHRITSGVTLLDAPATGSIVVQGVRYPNGAKIPMIFGVHYTIYGAPPSGLSFSQWTTTGNVIVTSASSQSTSFYADGSGTLTASYAGVTSSTSTTASTSSTTTTATTSSTTSSSSTTSTTTSSTTSSTTSTTSSTTTICSGSWSVVNTITVGSASGLLAVNGYVYVEGSSGISVISTSNNMVVDTIPVSNLAAVSSSMAESNGYLYVDSGSNALSVISLSSNTVVTSIPLGMGQINNITASNGYVYVGGSSLSSIYVGAYDVISSSNNMVVASNPFIGFPIRGIVASNGYIYMAETGFDSSNPGDVVTILYASNNIYLKGVVVGSLPEALASSNGNVYVSNYNSGSVSVISTSNNVVYGSITLGGAPDIITATGGYAYVSQDTAKYLEVISTSTNQFVSTAAILSNRASSLGYLGTHLYVVDGYKLYVIDTSTNSEVGTVNLPGSLYLAVSNNGYIYITMPGYNEVAVINSC